MLIVEGTEVGPVATGGMGFFIRAVEWPSRKELKIEVVPEPLPWKIPRSVRPTPRRTASRGMTVRRTKPREQRNARRKR